MKNHLFPFCLLLLLNMSAGCAIMHKTQDPDLNRANELLQQKKYDEAVSQYRQLLTPQKSSERDAAALYSIGLILSYYSNPHKDYVKALEAFDEFLERYPNHPRAAEALNWKHTIKQMQELRKSIEQLKQLDIRHEEKRRER